MPSSSARATARSWSADAPRTMSPPTAPQPKPRTESLTPVRPSARCSIRSLQPRVSGAQDVAGGGAGQLALGVGDLAVDDGVLDAAGRHHHALGPTGQVVAPYAAVGGADGGGIEDRDIGGIARLQAPASIDAEQVGGIRPLEPDSHPQH